MADKQPYFKFYPADWRADQALRLCSAAARGLWVECMCLMHEAKPYGHLLVNGKSVNDAQLAVQTGIPQDQVTALLGELESAGVFSRNGDGVIYSRKMTRLAKKVAEAKKWGKQGGNPALTLNPTLNPPDKPTPHLEARVHNLDKPNKEEVQKIVLAASSHFRNEKPISKSEIKARWQGNVCNWAQARLDANAYATFLAAWAAEEKWAVAKAEEFSREMKAAKERASA